MCDMDCLNGSQSSVRTYQFLFFQIIWKITSTFVKESH